MDMVSAGIIGLAFIALVVFCVLASKTWHWLNIASLVLAFIMGTTAIIGLTKVFKLRTDAVKNYYSSVEKLEKDTAAADEMIYGDKTSITYDPGSLRFIVEKLNREMAGRGRVWGGGTVAVEGEDRVFTFATPRTADAQPLSEVVLHAFLESKPLANVAEIPALPSVYIGSVRVSGESPENLKLQPVALAARQLFEQPSGTWTLFEKMPLDRRGTFKDATVALADVNPDVPAMLKSFAEGLREEKDLDLTVFRQIITTNFLPAQKIGLAPDSKEYEALVDRYVFDGQSMGRIQNWIDANSGARQTTTFEAAPEEVFIRYRFDKKSTKPFQVDATGNIETDGLFTPLGLAVDQALHAGKDITFAEGDTVLIDSRSANGYKRGEQTIQPLAGEPVTEVDKIYVRQVRNFPYEFKNLTSQAQKLQLETQAVKLSNAVQDKSFDDSQKQITVRNELTGQLEEDRENLQKDLAAINLAVEQKQQENAELKQKIASTQATIETMYRQLRDEAVRLSRKAFAGG